MKRARSVARIAAALGSMTLGVAAAMTAAELEGLAADAWSDAGSPNLNNATQCSNSAGNVADALETLLGAGATVSLGGWVGSGGTAVCTLSVELAGDGGTTVVEVYEHFSPSRVATARPNHIHGVVAVGGTLLFEVALRASASSLSHNQATGPTLVAGSELSGCFTPSLAPFAGPSPCNPEQGHGRFDDDAPADPPARGRSADAPGRNR